MSDGTIFTDLRRTFEWTCPECGSDHYDVGDVDGQVLTCEGCSQTVLVRWPGLSADGVVTEEPDWEYGVVRHDGVMVNNGDYMIQQTHRRHKAGPWVPVPAPAQQEGTEE